ncbi:MAG: hypothetical protein Q4C14_01485 [Bacillota bacterium]|nr:hypothetical protein [Bacillota bacterium]
MSNQNEDKMNKEQNPAEEQEIIVYGKSKIDGVAVPSAALVQATEDYPVVLMVGVDFIPVKAGDEIKTPYDAVMTMDEIQKIGPMIRIIKKVEPMTNVEEL